MPPSPGDVVPPDPARPRDRLLDRPAGTPSWIPDVDDERRSRWLWYLVAGVFIAGVGACFVRSADTPADPELDVGATFGTVLAELVDAGGEVARWCLLHADDDAQRQQGLKGLDEELGGYDGMLFSWEADVTSQFVMIETPTPLSIAWFRADGAFVSGTEMAPCLDRPAARCERYSAAAPYRYAVEVPRGGFADAGLAPGPGTRLTVGAPGCTTD